MEKNNLESSEKLGFFNIKLCSSLHFSPPKWQSHKKFGSIHAI